MKSKQYLFSDFLDFVIFTFTPAIAVVLQVLDFSYFLFDYGISLAELPTPFWLFPAVMWISLIASYRLHYCKYHKRMIWLILIVQSIGYFESYFANYIIEVNILMLILLYESLKALLQVTRIFILQSNTLRKIKTLHYAAKRQRAR